MWLQRRKSRSTRRASRSPFNIDRRGPRGQRSAQDSTLAAAKGCRTSLASGASGSPDGARATCGRPDGFHLRVDRTRGHRRRSVFRTRRRAFGGGHRGRPIGHGEPVAALAVMLGGAVDHRALFRHLVAWLGEQAILSVRRRIDTKVSRWIEGAVLRESVPSLRSDLSNTFVRSIRRSSTNRPSIWPEP
jgi:hypothetical protein